MNLSSELEALPQNIGLKIIKNRKILFSLILSVLVTSFLGIYFLKFVYAQESISVNVANVLQTQTTGGARLGINLDYWWDDQANRAAGARTLPAALADMGAKYWRYPGGEKADGYLWSTPPYSSSNPKLARISSQDWPSSDPLYWNPPGDLNGTWAHDIYSFDEFMADCQTAGCIPVMVVAYDGIYKTANSGGISLTRQQAIDTAVAWVNYANKVKGYNIKYWEIGNETWLSGYMGEDPGRTQQAQDFVTFCQSMKNIDSTIWCGISADNQSDWNTLLTGAGSSIDFLSVHSYEAWPYRNYSSYQKGTLNPGKKVDYAWNALQGYPALKDRIKIMVTETGGLTFGIRGSWTQADLGHSLMTFDILAQLQQDKRVEFSQVWNTHWVNQNVEGNVWPTSKEGEYDALKPDNNFTPQGLAMNILARYSLVNMVGTTSTSTVRTFASHDPDSGKLNIWLINKSTSATPTTVSLQNYTAPAVGTVSVLKGTGSTDIFPTFSQAGSVTVSNNQINLTLNPVSITVIELNNASSPIPTQTPSPTPSPIIELTPTPSIDTTPTPTDIPLPTVTPTVALNPTPTPIANINLALNRPATTSSVGTDAQKISYVGGNAVDGNALSFWWTQKRSSLSSEWITIDLGANYSISRGVLKQGDRWATSYSIKISQDNTNWTTVWSTTSGTQGTYTAIFTPVTARYIRMESTEWLNSGDRLKLLEFEIYQN